MLSVVLAVSLVGQTVTYQKAVFVPSTEKGAETGVLSSDEVACVQSALPVFYPAETEDSFLRIKYVRYDEDRTKACVHWTVERSEPISDFVLRSVEPRGVRFSEDGMTAYWPEKLARVCLTRGTATALAGCLLTEKWGVTDVLQLTMVEVSRSTSAEDAVAHTIWETVTGTPTEYAIDRAAGRAKDFSTEEQVE